MLAISDYLLTHRMSVKGLHEDTCHDLFRYQSEAGWPSHREVPQVVPFSLLKDLLLVVSSHCDRPLPITMICQREQAAHYEIT